MASGGPGALHCEASPGGAIAATVPATGTAV
ncbi:nicotinate phosphoribosyltransferase domain containing 1, isoform CRA_b [Rattus norvegicus]|uniref:Nicotinate phosphoribosyltransferase domain containing 1, isoform CRA_b n=1 Tax=Rattus norvegicus TaxID=10116 RepID=A6HS27_RAT|nr:nicotinate phosphoribosyltransferase domain containing 1, isoform CRA_b [Rattus norvegicus]